MSELWERTACDIAHLVRGRKVSAVEVAQDGLARLEAANPALNAVVACRPEAVLQAAGDVDVRIARGDDIGPLAGVLVTVKENIDQVGFATTNGVTSRKDWIADRNNPIVDNLEAAGAVILGRTNVPTFCYRWFTDNLLFGATANPRHSGLTPGGSSGGAAAAVAAGIGQVAHGSDIAGSIRYPAYACGIHGLRPGLGRVPSFNGTATERNIGIQLMATHGPFARSVPDLRLTYRAMAREDWRDPWWTPVPFEGPELPRRIALCVRPGGLATVPAVEAALRAAARQLASNGWEIVELDDVPPLREAAALQVHLWMGDGYQELCAVARAEGDPGAIRALEGQRAAAEAMSAPGTLSETLTRRAGLVREWQLFLARFAVVLMPVSAELPFEDALDLKGDEAYRRVWDAQLTMIALPFVGLPALTLCTGESDGVPIGIQLVANRFREDACLAVAEELERGGHHPTVVRP